MRPAIIAFALVLAACSPEQKKASTADAEKKLRAAAAEVVKIEGQLAAEKTPGMASLLTEKLREAKDRLASISKEHSGEINAEAIISDEQHTARMASLQENMQSIKDEERSREDAAGARLEAARKSAQEKNDSETR